MKIEILFHTSSTPKICKNVEAVYTKGGLVCVQYKNRLIIKYPLCNIFSIAGHHAPHLGSTKIGRLPKLLNETLETLPKDRVCVNTDNDPNWYDNEEDLTQEQLEAL